MPYSEISNRVYMSKTIDYYALGVRELPETAAKPGQTKTRVDKSLYSTNSHGGHFKLHTEKMKE